MKILIAADTFYPHVNGASYFTQRLAFYLQQRGHQVLVIAPSRTFRNEFYIHGTPIQGIRSVSVFVYKGFRVSLPFLMGGTVKKVIASYAPDIVHVQGHFFLCRAVLKKAKKEGLPTVGTNHFMPENLAHYFHLPAFAMKWLLDWSWKQFRSVFEEIDVITTPTRIAAELLEQIGLHKEVLPISCGIDLNRFCPSSNKTGFARKYGLPENRKILLYVGRLDKEKHVDLILHGFSHVRRSIGVHLVIAGRGAEENHLKTLTHVLGINQRVTFTGFVPDEDIPGLYGMADCFIIAGTAELQSIVTMEAMAAGLPIIGARAMALPELIHPGINGCLFNPGDKAGIADCITALFSNCTLKKEMSDGSLAIIQKHDIERTINQFETIYIGLAARKTRTPTS
jgi:glycosyltransferase involved in cell wall biosynthesis